MARLDSTNIPSPDARTWLTATDVADGIRAEFERGDEEFALRILARGVADFRARTTEVELSLWLIDPPSTGDVGWDTLLGATAARECRNAGIDAPDWTRVAPLDAWWFPADERLLRARTMQRTPVDFHIRGIWLDANALETL